MFCLQDNCDMCFEEAVGSESVPSRGIFFKLLENKCQRTVTSRTIKKLHSNSVQLYKSTLHQFFSFLASSKQIQIAAINARSTPGATVTKYCKVMSIIIAGNQVNFTVCLSAKASRAFSNCRPICATTGPPSTARSPEPPQKSPRSSIVVGCCVEWFVNVASILVPTAR